MKGYSILLGALLILIPSCTDEKSTSIASDQKPSFDYLQSFIDSGSHYYLKAIEGVERGEDIELIESQYASKIVFFHKKLSNVFDSITNEYMSKKISQHQYDEMRNSLILDSVIKRSERLSQLGLNINLD